MALYQTRVLVAAVSVILLFTPSLAWADPKVEFTEIFAPSEGFVPAPEKPLRDDFCLNGRWQFQPVPVPASFKPGSGVAPALPAPDPQKWEATPIKIPSPWNVNTWGNGRDAGQGSGRPYAADSVYYPSYPPQWEGVRMGWLRRTFRVPADWIAVAGSDRRLALHFEAVAGDMQVLINGKPAGTHFDSFLPFDLDITDLIQSGGDNELLVGVRKSDLFNIIDKDYPAGQQRTYPNGSNMDNLVGIWNDVFLLVRPAARVEDVFVQPNVNENTLVVETTLRNDTAQPRDVTVRGNVSPWVNLAGSDTLSAPISKWRLDKPVLDLPAQKITLPANGTVTIQLKAAVRDQLKLWSPDAPNLQGLVLDVTGADGKIVDRKYTRFGWREFRIHGRELWLNGKPLQLWGDFGHPFGPFIGSRRYVWADYRMIKDFGGNTVRPHANVMPRLWADLADEMGICMLAETAIFGSSINLNLKQPITWERFERHVDGLVVRDRNHPCIVGWSPANEMFALSLHTSKQDKEAQTAKLKPLAQRSRRLDPTRDWVSMDGDKDLDGTLPVWSRHAGIGIPDDLPETDKPLIIGEHGGTYFAGPPRLKQINGDRAYESYTGKNEALAIDLYQMLVKCAKPRLAAFSPSELVWFGLEQLPFGYRTDARVPDKKEDGVFFPNYAEDIPGVQIERLPPYVMTLNPGLDPALPLYKPLPMFAAIKAALDPRGPQPCPWDKPPVLVPRTQPPASDKIASVGFAGNTAGALFESLRALGVPLAADGSAADSSLLIVDGETIDEAGAVAAKRTADGVWSKGGLVWIMFRDKGGALGSLRDFLPADTTLTTRQASSLVHGAADPAIDGFALADLYFADNADYPRVQKAGLDGSLVKNGRVLLTACDTDWSLFERKPEVVKCSSVLIYEHVKKPAGAALVELAHGAGKVWVSTLDATRNAPAYKTFWTQLFRNIGVKMGKPAVEALEKPGTEPDLLLDGPVKGGEK